MARMLFLRDIDVDVHLRCRACGHGGTLPRAMLARRFGPNYPVLSIAPHYRCSRCNSRDTESRPAPLDRFQEGGVTEAPAEPSFDASLAALQGLLASVRGPETETRPPPSAPSWGGLDGSADDLDDPLPAFKPFATPERPHTDLAETDLAQTDLPETDWEEPEPAPAWTSATHAKARRPLEDLVADGPAGEDASPLWEPVSLADMAARLESAKGDATPASAEDLTEDEPLDETLAAMHRFFAVTDLDEEDGERSEPPGRSLASLSRADEEEEDSEPPVFSHKALVRSDFDDDLDAFDDEAADDEAADDDADIPDEPEDAEPTDEEILAFAIRDPEKPAPPPRAERGAKPPVEEDEGFDKTLAALRSMIEDAATEPNVIPVRRKTRPVAARPPDDMDSRDEEPLAKAPAKTSGKAAKGPGSKRSSQEREIEEAMKALRDMVEDDDAPAPKPAEPGPRGGTAKLDLVRDDVVRDDADDRPPTEPPSTGKKRADAGSEATTPLSKTIAALRGMLELDGRRKR